MTKNIGGMTKDISRFLDHAVLRPEMTIQEASEAIKLGIKYNVRTVCVRPCDIALAVKLCEGSETAVCCVLSFPHGTSPSKIKVDEAKLYIMEGVNEIDMVTNYGYIRSAEWDLVAKDIGSVAEITKASGVPLKVILETSMLTLEEVARATEMCIKSGASFVKTSTGFNGEGATEDVIRVIVTAAAGRIRVKASGGIRDLKRANMFIEMGCSRLGVGYNSTPIICEGAIAKENAGY